MGKSVAGIGAFEIPVAEPGRYMINPVLVTEVSESVTM